LRTESTFLRIACKNEVGIILRFVGIPLRIGGARSPEYSVQRNLKKSCAGRRFLYSCLPFSNLKYLYCLYPQFTRKTVRRHKICVLLRCFDSMHARYMPFLHALPGTNFMPSDSGDLKRREFLHFQGRRRRRTGSTLIEDNAENEEIIPF